MKNFTLTGDELAGLRAAHRAARKNNAKEAYKINAVILLGTGWTLDEVAEALLLDDESLRKYAKTYQEGGLHQLLKTFHKGSVSMLSTEQEAQLMSELDSTIYLSTTAINAYVKKEFGAEYSLRGLTNLLHRLNYVYKKPKLVPASPDRQAQEIFIKFYTEFMENKRENEAVFFVDAVHPVHNSVAGYGWIKKGKEKELKSNPGRNRLNIHGAMNAETFETTIIASEDNINTDSTVQLLQYLEKLYPLAAAIYVILDNAKYHFSSAVQEWVKNSRIKLVFLPAYSPELNLIERLWKLFKKNTLYNKFYETYDAFKEACIGFFKKQSNYYGEIQSIMGCGIEALA